MKKIYIKFVDFYKGFQPEDNDFVDFLRERYEVVFSDKPEYLFYSCFGNEHLKYDCIRIFYTGECMTPDFNECDYAIGFDRLSFSDRYIRIPLYNMFQYRKEYKELFETRVFSEQDIKQKTVFCNFIYSNCFAEDERTNFFYRMSKYKTVLSGGRYLNNVGGAVKDKRKFQEKSKFTIAFENTSYPGYCTEKLMEAFVAGTIPIYYGDREVAQDFNEEAFINCHRYPDFDAVVERVKELDEDDSLYLKMLNQAPIKTFLKEETLKQFLYNIVEQEYEKAARRPKSSTALAREKIIKRHLFSESYLYPCYRKFRNLAGRIRKRAL